MNSVNLKASVSFVGDGSTKKFYFGFDYINKQFVKVQVGADNSPLTYLTDYTVDDRSVTLTDTPAVGVAIRVYRETPSDRIVEWADGAFIKASQMTLESLQQLHLIEEAHDYPILNSLSKYPDGVNFNALGSRVINVSDPEDPQDAVTKHYMENVQGGFVADNTKILNEAKATLSATQQTQSKAQTNEALSKAWAESEGSPDGKDDSFSTTGKTRSARGWAEQAKAYAGSLNLSFIINIVHPVGSIWETTTTDNPNVLWAGTTWVKMDAGRVLISAGTYTENGTTYTYNLGDKGGEAKHPLTIEEMASHGHSVSCSTGGNHNHDLPISNGGNGLAIRLLDDTQSYSLGYKTSTNGAHSHNISIGSTGGNSAHENRPPYVVVNRWKRTA